MTTKNTPKNTVWPEELIYVQEAMRPYGHVSAEGFETLWRVHPDHSTAWTITAERLLDSPGHIELLLTFLHALQSESPEEAARIRAFFKAIMPVRG